jgi:uncharacterized lipoprotein YddW (UPF0748 family)
MTGLITALCLPWTQAGETVASPSPDYRFRVDAVDPTAQNNPKGAEVSGFRGAGQLVLYTPVSGRETHTNTAGAEAMVINGVVVRTMAGNSPIPADGWVISGHGAAGQWVSRFARPGARAAYDAAAGRLSIRFTPMVTLNRVDDALARAQSREPVEADAYRRHLDAAQTCRARLAARAETVASEPVTLPPDWLALADTCEREADRAFYNTINASEDEFRGTWVRPDGLDSKRIAETVANMKRLGVRHIFLETYYQGRTVYPSAVMDSYGLPVQHAQFQGGDPLRAWVEAAHREGLKVHAWMQVFFAGNRDESVEPNGPILQKYPQWRNVERPYWNRPQPVASDVEPGHYFLDPANPEVRAFLEQLLLETVSRYEIDGLNLDYIRYPASRRISDAHYLSTTWGYTEIARNRFKALIGQEWREAENERLQALQRAGKRAVPRPAPVAPPPDPKDLTPASPLWPRWVAWRKEQVSGFVQGISEKARARRPGLLVSAVVFPASDPTYAQKLQDYPRWAREGWIQALTPIGLSTIPARMAAQAAQLKAQSPGTPVYAGIFSLYNRETPLDMLRQIDALHEARMPGLILFDWSRMNAVYAEALAEGPFRSR